MNTNMQAARGRCRSHAKAILCGEHAVVYGKPAIAFPVHSLVLDATAEITGSEWIVSTPYHCAIMKRNGQPRHGLARVLAEAALENTLEFLGSDPAGIRVQVSGHIPPARGLGSSAAVAAAISAAVAQAHGVVLDAQEHFEIIQSVERVAHGTPSGLDARATTSTGPIWFEGGASVPLRTNKTPQLLIADTGVKGHTAEAVTHVRQQRQADATRINALLERIGEITTEAGAHLREGDLVALGGLMSENHRILSQLGVSHPRLDTLVDVALGAGALGAKLTGGGMGGCIIALVGDDEAAAEHEQRISTALLDAGAQSVWRVYEPQTRM